LIRLKKELIDVTLQLEANLFGLVSVDVRQLACEILKQNSHLPNSSTRKYKLLAKMVLFIYKSNIKRHPELSLRRVKVSHIKDFYRENVSHFFDILEKIIDENKLNGLKIFNVESGFQTV